MALDSRLDHRGAYRVVPVMGVAGAGKTRTISCSLAASPATTVHFRARPQQTELVPFVRALVDSLATAMPNLALGFAAEAATAQRSTRPASALADWFAEQLGTEPLLLALDDLHLVGESASVRDFVVGAIERSAPEITWIVSARDTHLWPLASWLARSIACVPLVVERDARFEPDVDTIAAAEAQRYAASLDDERATTARAIALLPDLRESFLVHIEGARELLAGLVEAEPYAVSGDRFRSSFSDALLAATARHGEAAFARARAALGETTAAAQLQFLIDSNAHEAIVAFLDSDGFALMDDGGSDIVDEAIARLSNDERRTCAVAVSLEAKRETELGRHDVAESWYLNAAKIAPSAATRARIEWAHACDLLRRSRADAIEILERVASEAASPTFRAMTTATLGAAYASAERWDEARAQIAISLACIDAWPDDRNVAVRALVYRQVAYVSLRDSEPIRAAAFARRAIACAERCGLDEIVAPALSVLVVVATSHEDDADGALDLLQRLERCAERLGNAFLLRYSLLAQLDTFGERAMWADVDRIEVLLTTQELENDIRHADETLVRIRALRAASAGNFSGAQRLLDASGESAADPELSAFRFTELGTYAAAGGQLRAASDAIARADAALGPGSFHEKNALVIRTVVQLALCEILIGNTRGARKRLARIGPSTTRFRRLQALHEAVGRVLAFAEYHADSTAMAMLDSLASLHACGLGGFASVLGALPLAKVVRLVS